MNLNDGSKSTEIILIGCDVYYSSNIGWWVPVLCRKNIIIYVLNIKKNNVLVFFSPSVYILFCYISLKIFQNGYSKCNFKRCAGYFFVLFSYNIIYLCLLCSQLHFFLWSGPIVIAVNKTSYNTQFFFRFLPHRTIDNNIERCWWKRTKIYKYNIIPSKWLMIQNIYWFYYSYIILKKNSNNFPHNN